MYKSIIMPKETIYTKKNGKEFLITHLLKVEKNKKVSFSFNFHEETIDKIEGEIIDIAVSINDEKVVLKFIGDEKEKLELSNKKVISKNIIDLYMNSIISK